ncbi:hypothetical protein EYZ11_002420 [Aspergillus tanneri]|uniref:Cytochrome P450 monooxygenase n=1 Tax=Aspergillus tanneri TaxID=1220188 RepID=A0A4S3JSU3_9EURO|nr:hypothetical protein EYZ11_002420 [Aspergillus tanneri]
MGRPLAIAVAETSYPAVLVAGLAVGLGILYLIGIIIYNVYFHPLARFPGPKSFAATRIPYIRTILKGRIPQTIRDLHVKYGKVIRIAPDELSFVDGDAWKPIYGTRPGHGQKPKDVRVFPPTANNVPSIIQSNDADHSRFRRLLSHAFSESSLRGQEPIVRGYIDLLIQRLHENANDENKPVDMVSWYNYTTFDVIGDLAFGEPFGCLEESRYHPWVKFILGNIKFGAYSNLMRRIPILKPLITLFIPKSILRQRYQHLELTKQKVLGRLKSSNERPDFFSHILKHQDTEKGMSFGELMTNASTLIIAGSETTATLLSGVTYYLLKTPNAYAKLKEEVRTAFKSDDEITLQACNQLTYIHAVINEGLRMYPPVAVGLPRIVDPQGDTIAGEWVPGGVST